MNGRQLMPLSVAAACLFLMCLHSLVDQNSGAAVLRHREQQQAHKSPVYRLEAPAMDRVYRSRGRLTPAAQALVGRAHKRQPETVPVDADGDEDFVYEEDAAAQQKRYDEYGHMRFGKRVAAAGDDSDDYGHMRFGKRSEWL